MPSTHSEEGPWTRVIEYEADILGLAFITVCITYGCRNAESPVGSILHEWRPRMGEMQ